MKLETSKTISHQTHTLQHSQHICLCVMVSEDLPAEVREEVLIYDDFNGKWLKPDLADTFVEVGYLSHVHLDVTSYRVKLAIEYK